jgi:hypothetical protein
MQLKLNGFDKNKTKNQRINEEIASNIEVKGIEKVSGLNNILKDVLEHYELENGIFKLRKEECTICNSKLRRKGIFEKEITLPGGVTLLLKFHQYSCTNCKTKVDRKLGSWFHEKEKYSSNVKADAVRIYLSHLSSYDAVKEELNRTYQKNISKRTVRGWLKKIDILAENILINETDFSGHFIYDEEYMKVYLGDVGKKGAKLERVEVYLLLFRDAVTKKLLIMLSDSLDKTILIQHWKEFVKWMIIKKIPILTFTTDGKREYDIMIRELNEEFSLKIQHAYCIFHLKKNLFEVSNMFLFGAMQTKKELPIHIKNQIIEINNCVDSLSKELFSQNLKKLEHQIQTFIPPLRNQIKRIRYYEENYSLHKEFPFLRTTNTCEHWFGETKPEKMKKGYKTKQGLLNVLRVLAVKKTQNFWLNILKLPVDIKAANELLISTLIYKENMSLPE